MTNRERALAMRAMREQGATTREIGAAFGISHQAVSRAFRRDAKKSKVPKPPRARAKIINIKKLSQRELHRARMMHDESDLVDDYAARPVVRGDCEPKRVACPWCDRFVVMKVNHAADQLGATLDDGQANVSCPECSGRVRYVIGRWEKREDGTNTPSMDDDARAEYARALNHCRPCAFLSCRRHSLTDVTEKGSLRVSDRRVLLSDDALAEVLATMPYTCSLDVADKGGITLQAAGDIEGLTRERSRQRVEKAMQYVRDAVGDRVHLRILDTLDGLADFDPDRMSREAPTTTALDTLPRVVRVLPTPPPAQERPTLDAEGRAIAALGMVATNPRRIVQRGRP